MITHTNYCKSYCKMASDLGWIDNYRNWLDSFWEGYPVQNEKTIQKLSSKMEYILEN